MKNLFVLFILMHSCFVKKIRKVNQNLKNNQDVLNLINNNKSQNEVELLLSINLIADPHFFPENGLDVHNRDPFGNKFLNDNKIKFDPGELSEVGKKQVLDLANKISDDFNSYNNSSNNSSTLLKDEIITISTRLKRSIDSALLLNKLLLKLNKINFNNQYVKKFNLEYFDIPLTTLGYNNKNNIVNLLEFFVNNPKFAQNNKNNFNSSDTVVFFIPSEYEKTVFPLNYQLTQCAKLTSSYESFSNSQSVTKTLSDNFSELINSFKSILKKRKFLRISNKNSIDFLNFEDHSLNFTVEANKILTDYFLTYEAMKSIDSKILITSPKEKFWKIHLPLYEQQKTALLDLRNYDSYYLKNFSKDFMKVYLNGLFKFVSKLFRSKVINSINDYGSKLKIINMIMHEFNIAGVIKALLFNKDNENLKLPKISYGTKLTLNLIKIKLLSNENLDPEGNKYIKITVDDTVIQTLKLADFNERMDNFILRDNDFFANVC